MRLLSILLVAAVAASTSVLAQQDPHTQMNHRGAAAMGFDQTKTVHHFLLFDDGGAIDIAVKDTKDATNRDAIRGHLPHIGRLFGDGNFETPMFVHDSHAVPGAKVLAEKRSVIQYSYVETPNGGRLDIVTQDPEALKAVHDYLKFQIAEHKTGDSLVARPRRP